MINEYKSIELNELFSALAKAQSKIKVASKDSSNPFFKSKYANLQAVIEASRPSLCENGLAVTQQLISEQEKSYLVTTLGHASGQWICSYTLLNPLKSDAQSLGSYITYLRRYSYAALIGVYDGEEDDDGNTSSYEAAKKEPVSYKISADQLQMIEHELDGYDAIKTSFLKGLKVNSFADVPRDSFSYIYGQIREMVRLEKASKK